MIRDAEKFAFLIEIQRSSMLLITLFYVSWCTRARFSLGYIYLGVKLLCHRAHTHSTLQDNVKLSSKVIVPIYIPNNSEWKSSLLHILIDAQPHLKFLLNWWVSMIFYCGFNLHFLYYYTSEIHIIYSI